MTDSEKMHEVFKRSSDSTGYYRPHVVDMEKQDLATGQSISDQLICRAIIGLAILVIAENNGHDIRFVKEKE